MIKSCYAIKVLLIGFMVVIVLATAGCNAVTRKWGGSQTIDLPEGMAFVEAEWDKQDNLWYTYRPRRPGEKAEIYIMQEQSNLGQLQGSITFVEH